MKRRNVYRDDAGVGLKRQEPRLRDWNNVVICFGGVNYLVLKRQEPRLRDWNHFPVNFTSLAYSLKRQEPRLRDWNIDANGQITVAVELLKRQEPRLRDWNKAVSWSMDKSSNESAWNDKNLDYEIETRCSLSGRRQPPFYLKRQEPRLRDWNPSKASVGKVGIAFLKRQEPRLRDWNLGSV